MASRSRRHTPWRSCWAPLLGGHPPGTSLRCGVALPPRSGHPRWRTPLPPLQLPLGKSKHVAEGGVAGTALQQACGQTRSVPRARARPAQKLPNTQLVMQDRSVKLRCLISKVLSAATRHTSFHGTGAPGCLAARPCEPPG